MVEGTPVTQILGIIKKRGYNREMSIEIGVVKTTAPALSVHLKKDNLLLEQEDLIVGKSVLPLADGDLVIVLADDDSQRFFILDKVGDLNGTDTE